MSTLLFIAYIAIFILQIALLVLSLRKKTKKLWLSLFLSEIIPMITAFILMRYYDSLPGYGFMPGLSYFGEVIFSLGAAVLYCIVLFVSIFIFVIMKIYTKREL